MSSTFSAGSAGNPIGGEADLFGAAPPSVPSVEVKKKPDGVLLFDDLKIGMHVKIRCACTGFISAISGQEESERWFTLLMTNSPCRGMQNIKLLYEMKIKFQEVETYFGSSFSGVFPAFEAPAPDWFPSIQKGPETGAKDMSVRIKIPGVSGDFIDLLVPSEFCSKSVYDVAESFRNMLAMYPRYANSGIEVEVVRGEDRSSILKKSKDVLLSQDQKNVAALKESIINGAMMAMAAGDSSLYVSGEVPLSKGDAVDAVMDARKSSEVVRSVSVRMTCRTKDSSSIVQVSPDGKLY